MKALASLSPISIAPKGVERDGDKGKRDRAEKKRETVSATSTSTALVLSSPDVFDVSHVELYGVIDRMLTTVVRNLELHSQM